MGFYRPAVKANALAQTSNAARLPGTTVHFAERCVCVGWGLKGETSGHEHERWDISGVLEGCVCVCVVFYFPE